jgi:hypothetical protein
MIDLLPQLIVLATSVWVFVDARTMGVSKGQIKGFFNMGPTGWFLSCLLCWIVAFPAYLVKRGAYKRAIIASRQSTSSVAPEGDLISQLSALADRHSLGLLSDEEFQAQKKQLVHRMQAD